MIYWCWRDKDNRYDTYTTTQPTHSRWTLKEPPWFNPEIEFPFWNGTEWELRQSEV